MTRSYLKCLFLINGNPQKKNWKKQCFNKNQKTHKPLEHGGLPSKELGLGMMSKLTSTPFFNMMESNKEESHSNVEHTR
jgi:hypothetical protein